VDESGPVSSVNHHISISGNNSGVYVSTREDDVKLNAGSELAPAIAAHG